MGKKKWQVDHLIKYTQESTSIRQVLIKLGLKPAGGNYEQIKKYIVIHCIDTSHLLGKGWNIHRKGLKRSLIPLSEILVEKSDYQSYKLKRRLFKEGLKDKKCQRCGWAMKSVDGRIPLELHHMNGNKNDNRLINLEILCPNCHSLEVTHRGKNIHR